MKASVALWRELEFSFHFFFSNLFFLQNFLLSSEIAENGAFTLVWEGGGTGEATGPAVISSAGL